ncbi:MAG: protein kinase [Myxococcales bacterium]|nr:protein kinase [Myxococcales bacterium]
MGAAPSFSSFAPGTKILDRYIIEEMIGVGGMGMVFRARHELLGETVAIKCLRADSGSGNESLSRFLREARASAQIKSQHVAKVHDVGTLPSGTPYMVMEYLEGQDLGELLTRYGAFSIHDAIEYALQACDALNAAHKLGVVHRDIKPANFFLTKNEHGEKIVKMLDFGISKTDGENLTKSAVMLGTPFYMAPEQLYSAKAADIRSDIWSMGVVMYELIEGGRPFIGESVFELGGAILSNPPQPTKKAWPKGLFAVVQKCLEKEPEKRFQSAAELLTALAQFDQSTGTGRQARIRRHQIEREFADDVTAVDTKPAPAATRAQLAAPKPPMVAKGPGAAKPPAAAKAPLPPVEQEDTVPTPMKVGAPLTAPDQVTPGFAAAVSTSASAGRPQRAHTVTSLDTNDLKAPRSLTSIVLVVAAAVGLVVAAWWALSRAGTPTVETKSVEGADASAVVDAGAKPADSADANSFVDAATAPGVDAALTATPPIRVPTKPTPDPQPVSSRPAQRPATTKVRGSGSKASRNPTPKPPVKDPNSYR